MRKIKGYFKTVQKKPYGTYTYYIACIVIEGVRHVRRCATEEQAAREYHKLREKFKWYLT
jgi:hypothetical protein